MPPKRPRPEASAAASSAAASSSTSHPLDALEEKILHAINKVDLFEKFIDPCDNPDNAALQAQLDQLVGCLDDVRKSAGSVSTTVPTALVHEYVDQGNSPDDYAKFLHERIVKIGDSLRTKQRAWSVMDAAMEEAAKKRG